jgi:YD repeat-containing protein
MKTHKAFLQKARIPASFWLLARRVNSCGSNFLNVVMKKRIIFLSVWLLSLVLCWGDASMTTHIYNDGDGLALVRVYTHFANGTVTLRGGFSIPAGGVQHDAPLHIDFFDVTGAYDYVIWPYDAPTPHTNYYPYPNNVNSDYTIHVWANVNTNESSRTIDDNSDGAPSTFVQPVRGKDDCGMPVWDVSEPYISLWLRDEPLGYQPAVGPRVSFELSFKQRELLTGWDTNVFSVGKRWNCSWFSYVTKDVNSNNVVYFANGGSRTYATTNDYLTNTRLIGNTTNGFTLSYPDGSKDVYGFIVTNSSGAFLNAFLTEHWNPQAQKSIFQYGSYAPGSPSIQLKYVIDGDGRTNSIYYTNTPYSANLISQVVDPFNRTNFLGYDGSGHLVRLTDVAGLSTSFTYDTNDCVTNMTTPYGPTSFTLTDTTQGNVFPNGRSVLVTQPDGGRELFLYTNNAPGIASSYPPSLVPSTAPYTNAFENAELNFRNSFHWGPRQYAALSSTNIGSFTANDFRKARMQHWLKSGTNSLGQTLSLERTPSPDSAGTIDGQLTCYDYAGKTNAQYDPR